MGMNEALVKMLEPYSTRTTQDAVHALREIMQSIALLGLWRARFFERGAFYGGTALRILYGLDRYSEDLDFSLLEPSDDFQWSQYRSALESELSAYGFTVQVEQREKRVRTPIQSAFLKANTRRELFVIRTNEHISMQIPDNQKIQINLEIDTDPPPGFITETKYVLQPVPFSARVYGLSDLFAGKMHAVLCRQWKHRVKGRDFYDLSWFAAYHPQINLHHLEMRMRQSGHLKEDDSWDLERFQARLTEVIHQLDVIQAREDVRPFLRHPEVLDIWSRDFFLSLIPRIRSQ
jgi:predicted nucleotidyltransferase component of viral defense system